MLIKLLGSVILLLLVVSFLLGMASTFFARRETIWKSLGLWGLGLGSGLTGIALSLTAMMALRRWEREADMVAGRHVTVNDMPGFGEALLGGFGLMYFAAIFCIIMIIFVWSTYSDNQKSK